MADLLGLSARYIDEGVFEGPGSVNRVTTELSEVADDVAVVEAFSHVVAFSTGEGHVLFDTSLEVFGEAITTALRKPHLRAVLEGPAGDRGRSPCVSRREGGLFGSGSQGCVPC